MDESSERRGGRNGRSKFQANEKSLVARVVRVRLRDALAALIDLCQDVLPFCDDPDASLLSLALAQSVPSFVALAIAC